METITKRIVYESRTDEFTLWFLGDLHIGSAACDEAAIAATVRAIRDDPFSYWVGLGDMAEFISRHDWRFRHGSLARWLRGLDCDYGDDLIAAEVDIVVDKLAPIADRCLALIAGNHEDKQLATFDRNVHREVCRRLGVLGMTDEAWIRLIFSTPQRHSVNLDIYAHHGWFAGRKSGSKVNNLHDLLLSWNVDIVAVGHGHERLIAPPLVTWRMGANKQLQEWRRYGVMTGSYMRAHTAGITSYASAKGYRPNDIGAVRLFFCPDKRWLRGEI